MPERSSLKHQRYDYFDTFLDGSHGNQTGRVRVAIKISLGVIQASRRQNGNGNGIFWKAT